MPLPARSGSSTRNWQPFEDVDRFSRQLTNYLDGFWHDSTGFTPMADVEELDDAYVVEIEVPGVAKDDLNIELADGRLVVTGERKEKHREGVLRSRTRTTGAFRYAVMLNNEVDTGGVTAKMEHGVLELRIPKAPKPTPTRIPIE